MSKLLLIGREMKLKQIMQNLRDKRHTLLIGEIGVGKTHLLRCFIHRLPKRRKVIYVEYIQPLKTALLSIVQQLHHLQRLKMEGIDPAYLNWQDLKKKVNRLPAMELLAIVINSISKKRYIIVLDHLEGLTPSMSFTVSSLMDKALVLGAANNLKDSGDLKRIYWRFKEIELKNLDRLQSQKLLWSYANEKKIADKEMFENKVLTHSAGNPLAIVEMAKRTKQENFKSTQKIRDLTHKAGERYIDLTPALLILGAVVVAARFVSLGLNDVDGYILAGSAGAFFMFLRFFLYRSMRRR